MAECGTRNGQEDARGTMGGRPTTEAVLLTGGNLGDREANLRRAGELIDQRVGRIARRSRIYESEPWGFEAEKAFLNQALVVETTLSPQELLDEVQKIEEELGRQRERQQEGTPRLYASRTMDIDILFYGDRTVDTPKLTIPHPRMAERRFVLRPLAEVVPYYVHPVTGITVADMWQQFCENEKRK